MFFGGTVLRLVFIGLLSVVRVECQVTHSPPRTNFFLDGEPYSFTCEVSYPKKRALVFCGNSSYVILSNKNLRNISLVVKQINGSNLYHHSLTLSGIASADDEDFYYCAYLNVSTFDVTKLSDSFELVIAVKPEVMVQTSVAAVAESAATLLCNATGKPLPDLEWWHDGQKLKAMKNTARLELPLPNVSPDQAGQYECRSSNMAGNASKSTELIVHLKPEVMVQTSVAAVAESAATLLCNATGKPLPDLEWWHDGQKLKAMKSTTRLELPLPNVSQDQAGQYECRSSNMAGNASKSTELIVHLKLKPEVMVQTSVAAVAESAATLLCNATGKPLPDLEWWHDGQKLKAMKSTTRLELLLPNVRQDQAGQYECRSSNMAGNASKSTELIVHLKPEVMVQTSLAAVAESAATLLCNATGKPLPDLEWWHDGQKLKAMKNTTRLELPLPNVRQDQAGQYECRSSNMAGNASKSTELKVYYLPPTTPPTSVTNTGQEKTSSNSNLTIIIAAACGGGLVLLMLIIIIVIFVKRQKTTHDGWNVGTEAPSPRKGAGIPEWYNNGKRGPSSPIAEKDGSFPGLARGNSTQQSLKSSNPNDYSQPEMYETDQDRHPGGAEPTTFTSFSLAKQPAMQQSMSIDEEVPPPPSSPPRTPPESPPATPTIQLSQDRGSCAAALSPPQYSSSPIVPKKPQMSDDQDLSHINQTNTFAPLSSQQATINTNV